MIILYDTPPVKTSPFINEMTLNHLFPKIDLNHIVYENSQSLFGENEDQQYLINKSDKAVIVFDKESKKNYILIFVFMNNILVNTVKSKHLFITISGSNIFSDMVQERYKIFVEFLEKFYTNDPYIHLGKEATKQIHFFMKSVEFFEITLKFNQECGEKTLKNIYIHDEVYNFMYESIIRDGLVYFTMMFNDDPEREMFVKSKFDLDEYLHYETSNGSVIDSFVGQWYKVETHYEPSMKRYLIESKVFDNSNSTIVESVTILRNHDNYDVNFIFNFVYDTVIIDHPRHNFVEKLVEMSILQEGESLTLEHMKLYDMATI